ncbi:MAG: hypothetical protein QOH63_18 [Acidobacteriota bacterium]|jgi:hypothetical protein|nr:hypothetical protein [Acidobacteriota bacterium]
MNKGTTINIKGNVGPLSITESEAKEKLKAALGQVNPDLTLETDGSNITVDSEGNLSGKAYITGDEEASVDFKALAQDALAAVIERLRLEQGLAPMAMAPGQPGEAETLELEEATNEDEDEGLIEPLPLPGAPVAPSAPPAPGEAPPRNLKRLFDEEDAPQPAALQPQAGALDDCPLGGDGGDHQLNELKNRTESGNWRDVEIAKLLDLAWPDGIGKKPRSKWTSSAVKEVKANEKKGALRVEGWLASVKKEGEESCNCHSKTEVDFHLWIVDAPEKANKDERWQSVVCEISPRVRELHTGWDLSRVSAVVKNRIQVRLSGWLCMDQEHPEQLPGTNHPTRGTLWEIHPIIEFEVMQDDEWVSLDDADL